MSLGQRIKAKRKEKKLTQVEVAKRLGIDNTTVSKWESDIYEPDAETLVKLAELFDTTSDYLLGRDEPSTPEPDPHAFAERLKNGLETRNLTVEDAAEHCGVTPEYIQKLIDQPKIPGTGTLYKLADLIKVTPSYLCGLVDNPTEHSVNVPKPKELIEFLEKNDVMLMGKILSEEDKEKLQNVILAIFAEAKEMNKRKR